MNDLLLVGVGALLLMFYSKKATIENLHFVEDGISIDLSNLAKIKVTLTVLVQNATSGSFTLQSLAGDVTLNGQHIGNVSDFTPAIIAPNSQVPIDLLITINDLSLAQPLIDYVEGNPKPLIIGINATANIDNAPLPLQLSFNPVPVAA